MQHTVVRVERERPCDGEFGKDLDKDRQRGKRSRDRSGFEVPAERGGSEVCKAEEVEAT